MHSVVSLIIHCCLWCELYHNIHVRTCTFRPHDAEWAQTSSY